jgi:uncharacterized membrane protein
MLGVLLTLHILVFVIAFAFTAGVGILSARVARSRDARSIHGVFVAARPLQWVGGIGWFVAGALGVWVAAEAGLPFDQRWLLWSYVAFVVLVVAGLGMHAPWQAKVIAASASSTDGIVTPELDRLLHSPVHPIASALSAVSFIALVYLMTAQPG